MKKRILIVVGMCVSANAFAGGYRVALQGQNALGMGHTGVAVAESAETVFFNPGAVSFLSANGEVSFGVSAVDSVTKYQNFPDNPAAVSNAAETNNPIGTPLSFYIANKLTKESSLSLGIYTPYGNAVEWPTDWAGSHLVNNIALKAIYIQPTVSIQISDKIGIGFGPTFVNGSVEFNRNLTPSMVDADGNRSNVTVSGENITGTGYNVGLFFKPSQQLSVGVSYRSRVDLRARGEKADFENIPASGQALFVDTEFDADLVLPAELTVGVSYDLGTTLIAFDVNRAYWSAYEGLDLVFANNVPDSINPRNYNDVNIYRFGVQQKFGDSLVLRIGAYYDQSPIGDGYYTPETARNDSIGYTAGASYNVSKAFSIDASFLYLRFEEFSGSYDHFNNSGTTISFGGDYISSATAYGLGFNYKY